jgi:ABC-type long-subunit fatty acid transport system fused permease/ATPase subunit
MEQEVAEALVRKVNQKFWVSLLLYALLAVVIWFTLGEGTTFVFGRSVQIKLIPLFILGTFVFRTVIAHEADKIRRRGDGVQGRG